jgi:regulator of PEP synthase PpsR (kinase-PPPase family)
VDKMSDFNRLVYEQMLTMEKLLGIQGELERCQEIEEELHQLQNETEVESIQLEIKRMKEELAEIQQMFEKQTEEVIQSYHQLETTSCK